MNPKIATALLLISSSLMLSPASLAGPMTATSPPAAQTGTAHDDRGQTLSPEKPARRIISLAPHITETLYAAGADTQIVGAVDYSDYPEAATRLPRIGSYTRLDLEAILALRPDLIIAWEGGNPPAQIEKLKQLGFRVLMTQPGTLDDVAQQLERYGRLLGTETVANAAAQDFRQKLAALRAQYAHRPKVRLFYQIWKAPLVTVGKPQVISRAMEVCGGENIFGQIDQLAPTVSLEAVLQANPEAIIATGMGEARPDWLDDWKRWPRLMAVQRQNLFHINPDLVQRHTPRLIEGTRIMCQQLEAARQKRPPTPGTPGISTRGSPKN